MANSSKFKSFSQISFTIRYDSTELRKGKMQALGGLLIAWGFADFFLSLAEIDIYMEVFNYYVPDSLWNWTPWIAVFIGTVIYRAGTPKR
jgi:hypothetical protein